MPFKTFFIIISLSLIAGEVRTEDPGNFVFRTGVGYDFVSQEYYLDTARYDPDSSLTATLLKQEYLDDKKGLLYIKYHPRSDSRQSLEVGWEQTDELIRALGWGKLGVGDRKNRFESEVHFERKGRYRGYSEAGEEFFSADSRMIWSREWARRLTTRTSLFGEYLAFDSTGGYLYNYHRLGGEAGVTYLTEKFDSWTLAGGVEKRIAPDTTVMNYLILKARAGYFGEVAGITTSVRFDFEKKDYNWDDDRDDYNFYLGDVTARIGLGKGTYLRPSGSLEVFDFLKADYFNYDYLRFRPAIFLEKEIGVILIAAGPRLELFDIATDYVDDDFFEYSLATSLDYYRRDGLLLILDNQFGYRQYSNHPEFYSNYSFDRLSLIANLRIWRFVSFEMLFTGEWEWHKISSDNARLFLISSRLICTF